MKRVMGGNDGIWHEWDKTYQDILVIYAERMTFDTLKEYRRAVGAFKKHKDRLFRQQEDDDAWKDFNKYKIEYYHHGEIFTDK